jgi:hypothetical protein
MRATVLGRRLSPPAGTRWVRVGLSLLAASVGVAAVADSLRFLFISWDTLDVIGTADLALAHLRSGHLQLWGGAFALLQAIPAFGLRAAGLSQTETLNSLVALNVLSFATLTWVSWRSLRRRSTVGALLLLAVLLSGTILWYLHSSFGEPLAAAVTLGAVVACLSDGRHWPGSALLLVAGVSKDTAVPFLLVLCLGASIASPRWSDASWRRRRVMALVLAGAASFLLTSAYNYARFGSILDVPYMDPQLYVPWFKTQVSHFAAVWVAPNGGLLLFWPSFGVLLSLAAVAVFRTARACPDRGARLRSLAPAAAVAAVLLGMTLVLSKFFNPMGWATWGPRLMVPWVPACAYLLVATYAGELERLLTSAVRPGRLFWPGSVALCIVSIPQYVSMMRPSLTYVVLGPDAMCPVPVYIQNGALYYYHCNTHMLWTKGSALLSAFVPGSHPFPLLMGCACGAALFWLVYRLRAASLAGDHDARRAAPGARRGVQIGDAGQGEVRVGT